MITNFKIFEGKKIWSYITNEYEDDEAHDIYIDGYYKNSDEGEVIATIDILTSEVTYNDERAKYDTYAQEIINDTLDNIVPKRKIEIEAEKYNL